MDCKIDYLSFTMMVDPRGEGTRDAMCRVVLDGLNRFHPAFMAWAETLTGWEDGGARGHYATSLYHPRFFMALRFGGTANHVLAELPGTACQAARDAGILQAVIAEAADRLTRLDLAVDFPDGCSPSEFVVAGYNGRFEAKAHLHSIEGDTEYVGSMKSERYARVYRYNPPHPRALTLRVEHVLRSGYAKSAAALLSSDGLLVLAAACGNSFGWQHPSWQPDVASDGKIRASRADRHEPGRIRWLYQVVVPAIAKAHREGLINAPEFCAKATELAVTSH